MAPGAGTPGEGSLAAERVNLRLLRCRDRGAAHTSPHSHRCAIARAAVRKSSCKILPSGVVRRVLRAMPSPLPLSLPRRSARCMETVGATGTCLCRLSTTRRCPPLRVRVPSCSAIAFRRVLASLVSAVGGEPCLTDRAYDFLDEAGAPSRVHIVGRRRGSRWAQYAGACNPGRCWRRASRNERRVGVGCVGRAPAAEL